MAPKTLLLFVSALAFSTSVCAGLNDGLVAYYPFEGAATDQSGNLNHGTEHGGVGYDVGILPGQALSLDGIDDFVQIPRVVENDFSVAFWVNTTASGPPGTQWFQGFGIVDGEVCGSPPGGDWGIAMIAGGHIIFADMQSTTEINDGTWHSVILTRDMLGGGTVLYLDGSIEVDVTGHMMNSPLTGPPWIGVGNNPCDVSYGRRFFPGMVDDLRFYDRVLSAEEIYLIAHTGIFLDSFE